MAVKSSGSLSLQEIATEFGDTAPHSMSEFVRGGSLVPDAGSNSSIRTATDGPMRFDHFYGAVNVIAYTASSGTNLNASTAFGSSWADNVPKELIIPSGVTLGSSSTGTAALILPTGMGGTLTIKNSGAIQGAGGSAGSTGGDAILAQVSGITIQNNGTIYSGGGGGGTGGTGGNGSVTTQSTTYPSWGSQVNDWQRRWNSNDGRRTTFQFGRIYDGGSQVYYYESPESLSSVTVGGVTYARVSRIQGSDTSDEEKWSISKTTSSTSSTSGGSGGSGGVGQGYNQSAASGSAGSAGGTNAGAGGTGGTGGAFGASGSAGATGSNGNVSNGSSGASGGLAGYYVNGIGNVTFSVTGTVAGRTT